jgi:hypothetical protein
MACSVVSDETEWSHGTCYLPTTVNKLVHRNAFPEIGCYAQGIQYGSSLGSLGCNRGRIVNLHSLHDSSTLRAVKTALMAVVLATESILQGAAEMVGVGEDTQVY